MRRLRLRRDAILVALERFEPRAASGERQARVLSLAEVALGATRIKGRSSRPWHDLSLYYLLFATGLRPLEVARLEVRDYLGEDGAVRRETELRADVAINGKSRPLFFASHRLNDALAAYLRERQKLRHGLGDGGHYRGMDPGSRLFLRSPASSIRSRRMASEGRSATCAVRCWRSIASFSGMPTSRVCARSRHG